MSRWYLFYWLSLPRSQRAREPESYGSYGSWTASWGPTQDEKKWRINLGANQHNFQLFTYFHFVLYVCCLHIYANTISFCPLQEFSSTLGILWHHLENFKNYCHSRPSFSILEILILLIWGKVLPGVSNGQPRLSCRARFLVLSFHTYWHLGPDNSQLHP